MYSDKVLLEQAQAGDDQAFKKLFDLYWLDLYKTALVRLKDEDAAKDMVQDVFLSLWLNLKAISVDQTLRGYLHTLLKNKILNSIAHKTVAQKYEAHYIATNDGLVNAVSDDISFKELSAIIEQELNNMPPRMKQIYSMNKQARLSIQEIATQLGISYQTVKNQIHSANTRLRARITNDKAGHISIIVALFYWLR